MKPVIASILLLAMPAFGDGDKAEKGVRPTLQVSVEFIETPVAEANRIIATKGLTRDGEKLRAELQALVEQDKATVLDTALVSATSGGKATVESIREMIYPTEYEPPALPGSFSESYRPRASDLPHPTVYPPLPTAFTTRNTGNTLEVEPAINRDGRRVEMRFAPEWVIHTSDRHWPLRKGEPSLVEPYFYSFRSVSNITCADGIPVLLTLLKPSSSSGLPDDSRKVFVIVTVTVLGSAAP